MLSIDGNKIVINQNYDTSKLKQSQKYILNNIENGKLKSINKEVLQEKVKDDALQDELIEEKNEIIKKQIKKFITLFIVMPIAFMIFSWIFKNFGNSIVGFIVSVTFLSISLVYFPIISIVSIIVTIVKHNSNPYYRTEKGKDINKKVEGLKNFLEDYTVLDERKKEEIALWEEYLVYSVLFNQNKKIIDQYKKYIEQK